MLKTRLACSLGLLLFAAPALFSQTNSGGLAAAPKGIHPKSKAENSALNDLKKMITDTATTGDQLDAAITDFVTKFPTSDYLATVDDWGLQFYQTDPHKSYEKSLLYGEAAIKNDPNNLQALTTVGSIIPGQVKDTDLDRDQRLQEATSDDNQAIKVAEESNGTLNGQPFLASAQHFVEASAYSSLAQIADLNQDYTNEAADYQKAIPLDDPAHQAYDNFYMARAEIQLKQYPAALAALDAAAKAAPNDANVQAAVESNRKLIAKLQSGH